MREGIASLVSTVAVVLSLCACGGEDSEMPDVESSRLDLALSDIERAGYNPDDVEIVGGGALGVVDRSNWTVCEQEPAAGSLIEENPRLVVDRECDEEPREGEEVSPEPSGGSAERESARPSEQASELEGSGESPPAIDEKFRVPALVGKNLQDAQDELQALGSYFLTQTDATGANRFQVLDANWKVCYQVPRAGNMVSTSTLIDLGAVKLEEVCP